MSGHNIHDLERKFNSFTANIGADDDGNETAYLYHPDSGEYMGCVTTDAQQREHLFMHTHWPHEGLTGAELNEIGMIVAWLKLREHIKHTTLADESLSSFEQHEGAHKCITTSIDREGGAERYMFWRSVWSG